MKVMLDLETLLEEAEESLYSFIYEDLNVPESITTRDIASIFFAELTGARIDGSDLSSVDQDTVELERSRFEMVCRAVPKVPDICFRVIGLALGGLAALRDPDGEFIEENDSEVVQTLMTVNYARGIATNAFRPSESSSVLSQMARKRTHHIAHAINLAKKRCSNLNDPGSVWAVLVDMAKSKSHGLLGVTPKGLQYLDANDVPKEFSKKQLTAYLLGSNLNRNRLRKSV